MHGEVTSCTCAEIDDKRLCDDFLRLASSDADIGSWRFLSSRFAPTFFAHLLALTIDRCSPFQSWVMELYNLRVLCVFWSSILTGYHNSDLVTAELLRTFNCLTLLVLSDEARHSTH